jgi:hypothetical protein
MLPKESLLYSDDVLIAAGTIQALGIKERSTKESLLRVERERQQREEKLFEAWMEYVRSVRIQNGMYEKLPEKRRRGTCCGRSEISYPHWPPTSVEEARVQYQYCLREHNTHRKLLVHSWWAFFSELASWNAWKVSENLQRYQDIADEIWARCAILRGEPSEKQPQKRPRGWRCFEYCDPVLKEGTCSCLCHCEHHRDDCPVHSW